MRAGWRGHARSPHATSSRSAPTVSRAPALHAGMDVIYTRPNAVAWSLPPPVPRAACTATDRPACLGPAPCAAPGSGPTDPSMLPAPHVRGRPPRWQPVIQRSFGPWRRRAPLGAPLRRSSFPSAARGAAFQAPQLQAGASIARKRARRTLIMSLNGTLERLDGCSRPPFTDSARSGHSAAGARPQPLLAPAPAPGAAPTHPGAPFGGRGGSGGTQGQRGAWIPSALACPPPLLQASNREWGWRSGRTAASSRARRACAWRGLLTGMRPRVVARARGPSALLPGPRATQLAQRAALAPRNALLSSQHAGAATAAAAGSGAA
jgi:hypothetical protein